MLTKTKWEDTDFSGKNIPREEYSEGFKDFQSLKLATRSTIYVDGKKLMMTETKEIEFPDKIDDAVFSRPPGKKID